MYVICLTNDGEEDWTLDANEDEIIGTGAGFRVSHTHCWCPHYGCYLRRFLQEGCHHWERVKYLLRILCVGIQTAFQMIKTNLAVLLIEGLMTPAGDIFLGLCGAFVRLQPALEDEIRASHGEV